MANADDMRNSVQTGKDVTTAHAAGIVVLGCLALLILLRMGFRGVSVGGASVTL